MENEEFSKAVNEIGYDKISDILKISAKIPEVVTPNISSFNWEDYNNKLRDMLAKEGRQKAMDSRNLERTAQNTEEMKEKMQDQIDQLTQLNRILSDRLGSIQMLVEQIKDLQSVSNELSEDANQISYEIIVAIQKGSKFDLKGFIADKGADAVLMALPAVFKYLGNL